MTDTDHVANERTARCCCGDLSITVTGEPHHIHRCSCDYCQRRTGNVFQVSCWYREDQVAERRGEFQVYQGHPRLESSYAQVGREAPDLVINHKFCKRCGSTVYWEIPLPPGTFGPDEVVVVAIAVGCFFEAEFPMPDEDHFVRDRHHWVPAIEGATEFDTLPPAHEMTSQMTCRTRGRELSVARNRRVANPDRAPRLNSSLTGPNPTALSPLLDIMSLAGRKKGL